jgi:hypothetical protein
VTQNKISKGLWSEVKIVIVQSCPGPSDYDDKIVVYRASRITYAIIHVLGRKKIVTYVTEHILAQIRMSDE